MSNDGKQLEGLVASIEKLHLPAGFTVKSNERVFNDDGVQIAEFDIEIRGKLGTTEISWLIECRDRPGQGPAPSSWIEQLVGRRTRFQFNRVTAVSTTGFAQGAVDFAEDEDIEIREVRSLTADHIADWLTFQNFPFLESSFRIKRIVLFPDPSVDKDRLIAFRDHITTKPIAEPILRSIKTETLVSPRDAFDAARSSDSALESKFHSYQVGTHSLHVIAGFDDDDYYVVDLESGSVRILRILFDIEVIRTRKEILPTRVLEYAHSIGGAVISQSAAFDFTAFDMKLSLEMHKVNETGQTHLILRNLGKTQ